MPDQSPGARAPARSHVLVVVLLLAACVIGSWLAWRFDPDLLDEEGPHEWVQSAVLLAGAFAHGWATRWGRSRAPGMLARSVVAMLCLSFALREMDVDTIGESPLWGQFERVVRGVGWTLWVVLIVTGVRRLRHSSLRVEVFAPPLAFHVLVVLGGLCMLAGWPFDKNMVPIDHSISHLLEETFELSGYALLLAAARVRPLAGPA